MQTTIDDNRLGCAIRSVEQLERSLTKLIAAGQVQAAQAALQRIAAILNGEKYYDYVAQQWFDD